MRFTYSFICIHNLLLQNMNYLNISRYIPFFFTSMLCLSTASIANAKTNKEQALVDHATLAVQDIYTDISTNSPLYTRLKNARAVMICPNITYISLVFGGSGGGCLLLSRDAQGSWSSPAFYKMSSGSFGLQFGVQNTKIMLFIMNESSLRSILDSQFTMGAGASATAANASSSTEGMAQDIYAIQKSSGLFAGVSLKGSKLNVNSKSNHNYYNDVVGPEDIVMSMRVNNSGADPLRRILIKLSKNATEASHTKANSNTNSKNSDAIQLAPESTSRNIKSENLAPLSTKN